MTVTLDDVLATIDTWAAAHAAAAVVGPAGVRASHGPADHRFRWASVTKLVTALAVLTAVDEGVIDLDEPAGPPGSTVRHLLAHASGLPFDSPTPVARPASTRIYSNPGFDVLGDLLAARDETTIADSLDIRVLQPLGMTATVLRERASQGLHGPLEDVTRFAGELLRPTLIPARRLAEATSVAFPGLAGVLPGVGRFDPLDWGLGFELRDDKDPHWTGRTNSPRTFGHFGGAGTFLWVDPAADVALVCLTDREYGPWAQDAWPPLSDAVLAAIS